MRTGFKGLKTKVESPRWKTASVSTSIPRPSCFGFTLIELMAVIGIMGLMLMVAMPAFKGIGGASQIVNAGRQFNNALMQARQYAVTRRAQTRVVVAYDETVQDSSAPDSIKAMNCSAYAIMYQDPPLGGSPGKVVNQPNLPPGQNKWTYIQPWRFLPKGAVFDPAREPLRTEAQTELPPTTLFSGDRETPANHSGTTLDELPIPNDLVTTRAYKVAFVEFSPTGTPTVGGSVRLVNGFVEPDGTLVVHGRQSPTTAQGSGDPAAKNCVVLQWDAIVGRVKWIQPGQ